MYNKCVYLVCTSKAFSRLLNLATLRDVIGLKIPRHIRAAGRFPALRDGFMTLLFAETGSIKSQHLL